MIKLMKRVKSLLRKLAPADLPNLKIKMQPPSRSVLMSQQGGLEKHQFSILTPIYNTPELFLRDMIESVLAQTYANWQLCMADGSDFQHASVGAICREYAARDSRITYCYLEKNKGISENTNACIEIATGDYFCLLDHDDALHPCALYEMNQAIEQTNADLLYSDEAKFTLDATILQQPNYKPDFSLEELRAHNYICHLTVYKRSLLMQVGRYQSAFDGSQDHDMVLRLSEHAKKIVHLPKILYFWRVHAASVSQQIAVKQYAVTAAQRAVEAHLMRQGICATVENVKPYSVLFHVCYQLAQKCAVTVIIYGTATVAQAAKCKTAVLACAEVKQVLTCENMDFAELQGLLPQVTGQYILWLDASAVAFSDRWLNEMLMLAQREDVSAVGAKLMNTHNRLLSGGITYRKRKLINWYAGTRETYHGYEACLKHVRRTDAVWGGCMLVQTKHWLEGNATDALSYCLYNSNRQVLWTPFALVTFAKRRISLNYHGMIPDTISPNDNPNLKQIIY